MEEGTYCRRETANHLPKEGLNATVALEDCSQKVFSSLGHAALRSLRALGEIRLYLFQIISSKGSRDSVLSSSKAVQIFGGSVSRRDRYSATSSSSGIFSQSLRSVAQ